MSDTPAAPNEATESAVVPPEAPAEPAGPPAEPAGPPAEPAEPAAPAGPEPETHAGAIVTWSHGQEVLHPTLETYIDTVTALKAEGFIMCVDVTAVDYLNLRARPLPDGVAPERFEVVANLLAMEPPRRIRVRVQVPEAEATAPSLWDLYPGVEAMEREAFDLLGIRFSGHPDLTRILMPDDWEGHPLRKDYAIGAVPVQFKAAPARQ